MTHPFENDLVALKEKLLIMSSHAGSSLQTAIRALVERDNDLAQKVIQDDAILDKLEIEIDEMAIVLLSKAPLASDLRLITMAMKICRDLERVGDEATTIARRCVELGKEPQLKPYIDIPRMARMAHEMLHEAMDAFVRRDPERARQVIPRDREVDQINKQLHRELASFIIEKPGTLSVCLHLMVISKSIERIADHAKNIAEEVVYLYEARDIRHSVERAGDPALLQ